MRRICCFVFGAMALTLLAHAAPQEKTQEKAAESRTLKVKLNYTGAGAVDDKHKIIVFLFDSPDFVQGGVMPFSMKTASAKNETITIPGIGTSPVFVVAVYDPAGDYDGQSGPPPSGAAMGMYSKTPGTPEPVKIEPGKTEQIELAFDDTAKMP